MHLWNTIIQDLEVEKLWLGARKVNKSQEWTWDNGDKMTYTNWRDPDSQQTGILFSWWAKIKLKCSCYQVDDHNIIFFQRILSYNFALKVVIMKNFIALIWNEFSTKFRCYWSWFCRMCLHQQIWLQVAHWQLYKCWDTLCLLQRPVTRSIPKVHICYTSYYLEPNSRSIF